MGVGKRAADLTGRALGGGVSALSKVRRADKPLHPTGEIATGTLARHGSGVPTGVDWLDTPGLGEVFVRVSRGGGLPSPLPDVFGLAVRVQLTGGRLGDLLFSTTGSGPLARYLIRPALSLSSGKLGTLMPYRTPRGARLLAVSARLEDDRLLATMYVARPFGDWTSFATLTTDPLRPDTERDTSFDALLNTIPELEPYDWISRVRERGYAVARRARGARAPQRTEDARSQTGQR